MKGFFKLIIFSIIFITIFSIVNATAASGVLKAYDALGAHHANAGEDFNLSIKNPDGNITADYNYAVFFRWDYINYNAQSGSAKYWDLNAVDANLGALSDENVIPARIVGGGCISNFHSTVSQLDMNIIRFIRSDANTFEVKITVPVDANHQDMNGKAGVLELWRLSFVAEQGAGAIRSYTCTNVDANVRFVIGPAIVISPEFGAVDGNVTVFGYGFPTDANVRLKFKDANGAITDMNFLDVNAIGYNLYAEGYNKEMDWNQQKYVDGNANTVMRIIPDGGTQWNLNPQVTTPFYGYMLRPDANGQFDVNFKVPFTISLAGPNGIPDNNIRVDINSGLSPQYVKDMNATAKIIVTPGFTMSVDENVTIGICQDANGGYNTCKAAGTGQTFQRVPVDQAMRGGMIRNQGQVSGLQVQLKTSNGTVLIAQIKMNSDMNMATGPRRDYDNGMDGSSGRAKIDSDTMPEFGTDPFGNPIDANITLYNIKSTGAIPALARNGKLCPATVCKNLDAGTFSYTNIYTATDTTPSWVYDPIAGDGNLSFRVSGFSEYSAGSLFVTVTGDSNAGRTYYTRDGNLTVTFTYKDTNYQDQNSSAWKPGDANFAVSIYLSKKQCGQHYLLYTDYNILDYNGISCTTTPVSFAATATNGYALNDDDANISTTQTCSISLDLARYKDSGEAGFSHFTGTTGSGTYIVGTTRRKVSGDVQAFPDLRTTIMGQFYIDINMSAPRSAAVGNTICATSDANTIINKPSIYIWDTNFMNSYGATFFDFNRAGLTADQNLAIDFNVRIQDTNLSLGDLNLSIYYSQTRGDKNNLLFKDLNLMLSDTNRSIGNSQQTTVKCTYHSNAPVAGTIDENHTTNRDTNCRFYLNAKNLFEGRYFIDMLLGVRTDNNRGAGSWAFDVNSRMSTATSDQNSTRNPAGINDTNNPILTVLGASSSTGLCVGVTMDANDTSNIKKFWYSSNGTNYLDNGMVNTYNVCITSSASLPATLTYYFKAMDFMDLNSSAQSKTITFSSASGGSVNPPVTPPPITPTGPGGGTGTPETPTTETIIEQAIESPPLTSDEIALILTEAGYASITPKMLEIAQAVPVSQSVKVEKNTSVAGVVSYNTTITIALTNNSTKNWKDIKLVVEIPKAIAANASEITSSYSMKVLKSDPIIEFTVPTVNTGEIASVTYEVAKNITDAIAGTIRSPIVTGYTEVKIPVIPPAGPKCGNGTCENGETTVNCPADCPAPAVTPQVSQPPATGGINLATAGLIILIVIAIVTIGIAVTRSKKNKLGYKK
jgi:hypothetical protein